MERIQKILAAGGIASRRAAERLIAEGRVRVNGRVVTEPGTKADPRNDRVEVDGKRVVAERHVYIVLHKPRGVVATMSDPEGRPTVRELLASVGARVFPVGRLDFATSGVLLATNDGEMADGLLHPRKAVPKTYVVKVHGKMAPEDLDVWRQGIRLEDGMTLPAEAKLLRYEGDKTWIELTIREGKNQQIRRMGDATRFPVMRLARVSFAAITAEHLRPGQWRHMTRDELVALKKVYGVPRSISAPPADATPARRTRSGTGTRPEARTRSSGAGKPAPRGDDAPVRDSRGKGPRAGGSRANDSRANDSRANDSRANDSRANDSRGRGSRGRDQGSASAPRDAGAQDRGGPRYGGGAPGRRGYDVKDDWGGGVRRGSSGGRDAEGPATDERPYPQLGGGRGGRTRTTGTAGGPATTRDGDRVKTRRG